ncbi:hypothetical protein VNO80_15010 [Phaseolus coccineus]|uniref:Uncharacterized protein n=1 Tax=Phaseolus coccineus TaxID=3886 RepID=A0AAN9MMW3_PHACN
MLFYSLEKLERMYSPWIISIQSRPLKHLRFALAALTPRLHVNDCCHRQMLTNPAAGWSYTNSNAGNTCKTFSAFLISTDKFQNPLSFVYCIYGCLFGLYLTNADFYFVFFVCQSVN